MPTDNKIALMNYRLEQSENCLRAAHRDLNAQAYKDAANRSYYSIFHAIRAVLACDEFDSKKHSGVISAFRQRYIKTGIFPAEFSDIIQSSFNNRGKSDYSDFFVISKDDTAEQIENAAIFVDKVKSYIETLIAEEGN